MAYSDAQETYDAALRRIYTLKPYNVSDSLSRIRSETNQALEALGSSLRIPASVTEYTGAENAKLEAAANEKREKANWMMTVAGLPETKFFTPETFSDYAKSDLTLDQIVGKEKTAYTQEVNQAAKTHWSGESEAFSRVMDAMNNGTAKIIKTEDGLGITAGGHPGYDTLYLSPTGTPNVYQFSTPNQVAGGTISGVIAANPETGKYQPISDYTKQIQYTPGQSGGFLKNTLNDLGPLGNLALAVATGGMSIPEQLAAQTALGVVKGQSVGDALKTAALAVGGSQLAQGVMGGGAAGSLTEGMGDAAAAYDAGLTGVGSNVGAGLDTGIAALAPETTGAVTSPVSTGTVTETGLPSLNTPTEYTPELNVGTAAPTAPTGIETLPTTTTPASGNTSGANPAMRTGAEERDALDQWMKDYYASHPTPQPASIGVGGGETDVFAELPGQGEGAFPGAQPGTVAMDQAPVGIEALPTTPISTIPGQGEGAFPGTEPGTVAADQPVVPAAPSIPGHGEGAFPGTEPGTVATDNVPPNGLLPASPSFFQKIADATGLPLGAVQTLAAGLGLGALGKTLQPGTDTNNQGSYTGPLANIQYNPSTYTPYTYKPYAMGGAVEGMSNANALGTNTGFPMADIQHGAYATPYQQPISQNVVTGAQDTQVDPYTGEEKFAMGGIADLGGYSDGGRLLRGPGDGVSDSIPAMIGGKQPARLADGEFVIPARIVSELGNGSTEAGARQLYAMMDRIQAARRNTVGKDKVAANTKAAKHLPA